MMPYWTLPSELRRWRSKEYEKNCYRLPAAFAYLHSCRSFGLLVCNSQLSHLKPPWTRCPYHHYFFYGSFSGPSNTSREGNSLKKPIKETENIWLFIIKYDESCAFSPWTCWTNILLGFSLFLGSRKWMAPLRPLDRFSWENKPKDAPCTLPEVLACVLTGYLRDLSLEIVDMIVGGVLLLASYGGIELSNCGRVY